MGPLQLEKKEGGGGGDLRGGRIPERTEPITGTGSELSEGTPMKGRGKLPVRESYPSKRKQHRHQMREGRDAED